VHILLLTQQEWNDEVLNWNPADYGGIEEINVDSSHVWVPRLLLYNKYVELMFNCVNIFVGSSPHGAHFFKRLCVHFFRNERRKNSAGLSRGQWGHLPRTSSEAYLPAQEKLTV
jgi:hypothetical protein